MTRPTLAIAIPTYCRPQQIALNFAEFMQEAADLGVAIYVSDDSPDDETERLATIAGQTYGNVTYRRNTPSLGHDANVIQTLLWPDADYVWIMGDVFRTSPGGLAAVLETLTGQDFEFINRNATDRRMIAPCAGQAAVDLIQDKIWHQTLTGGTIYHNRVREWVRETKPSVHRNFPHLDVILGYAAAHPVTVGWFGQPVLENAPKQSSYWHHKALDVFVDDWVSVITAYPTVLPVNRRRSFLKSHSAHTRLFNIEFLLQLKTIGHLDWKATRRRHFWDVMHLPRAVITAILMTPNRAVPHIIALKHTLENKVRGRRS